MCAAPRAAAGRAGEPLSPLVCGPLVRHVSVSGAVLWLELDESLEVEVRLGTLTVRGSSASHSFRAWPVRVEGGYYVWVPCRYLLPDTRYSYEVLGHRADGSTERLWPDRRLSRTPLGSAFRTLPRWSLDLLRIVFGSCRTGYSPNDPEAADKGPDALHALALRLMADENDTPPSWPHFFLWMGDQVYADDPSKKLRRKFAHTSLRFGPADQANTFRQFAEVYREAWTETPAVRWLLSCVPSFMIFDDHEVVDDWNISDKWVRENRRSAVGRRRVRDGLLAYWIYQGAGNLSPRRWTADERMRPLTPRFRPLLGDVTHRLRRLFDAYTAGRRRATWSYSIDAAGTRVVVADTRMSRRLTGRRLLMDDIAWSELVQAAKSPRGRRVLLVVPAPVLVSHPLHDLLSLAGSILEDDSGLAGLGRQGPVSELVKTLDRLFPELGRKFLHGKIIEDVDAELWAAFQTSWNRMVVLLEELIDGRGTNAKSFVGILAGDVHHSYVMQGELARSQRRGAVLQFTMSPIRRLMSEGDAKKLRTIYESPWYVDLGRSLGTPPFVEQQKRRCRWYPLKRDGSPAAHTDVDAWASWGTFLGRLELRGSRVDYRYERAVLRSGPQPEATPGPLLLEPVQGDRLLAIGGAPRRLRPLTA